MTTTTNGYVGRQLRVNLTTRDSQKEVVAEELQRKFLGGASYAAKVLYDELPAGIDPLGPENKIVLGPDAQHGECTRRRVGDGLFQIAAHRRLG